MTPKCKPWAYFRRTHIRIDMWVSIQEPYNRGCFHSRISYLPAYIHNSTVFHFISFLNSLRRGAFSRGAGFQGSLHLKVSQHDDDDSTVSKHTD